MEKMKDPAIKLFGKEIGLPENGATAAIGDCSAEDGGSATGASCLEGEKASRAVEEEGKEAKTEAGNKDPQLTRNEQKEHSTAPNMEEESSENSEALPVPEHDEIPKSPSATAEAPKTENDQSDANNPQQKPLKKPDKILPCPRCNSMDTKFCYYNNYNINQPRHFCKSCQRYWTAGGTMRNVPVGAGRRKTKNSASPCHHITISEALQAARVDAPNGAPHPAFEINGSVLSFGPDSPLCESIASALNLADKKAPNGIIRRGFYRVDQGKTTVGRNGGENGDDCSCGSSVTTSNSVEEGVRNGLQEPILRNLNGMSSQIPCLHGVPWPYPWNPAVPVPAFYPPGFPIPIYPSPYWNCSIPGAWSVPWLPPPSPSTTQKTPTSTLGKHSREGNLLKPSNQDEKEPPEPKNSGRSILIPKTLRIDNPDEAARSSIWTTLGIKNDSTSRIGLFKAFQAKGDEKNHAPVPPSPLQANPAALSRSLSFQEGA